MTFIINIIRNNTNHIAVCVFGRLFSIFLLYYEENRHHRQAQPGQNEANGRP